MTTNTIPPILSKDKRFSIKTVLQQRFFIAVVRLAFAVLLIAVLYFQLFGRQDINFTSLMEQLQAQLSGQNSIFLIAVVLLMPLNWLLETFKWRSLMHKDAFLTISTALKAVMAGLTVSLFTPNRIGEYGGRVMMVPKTKRIKTVLATIVGSFSQWIVLIVGGWWAMMYAFSSGLFQLSTGWWYTLLLIGILFTSSLLLLYYNIYSIAATGRRFAWLKTLAKRFPKDTENQFSRSVLTTALVFAFLRYATYSLQYVLLLLFFGFEADLVSITTAVMLVYMLQTGIPLPPSTGLLARGNIALFVFGSITSSNLMSASILAATFGLWTINVVIPASIGGIYLLKANFSAKKGSPVPSNKALNRSL